MAETTCSSLLLVYRTPQFRTFFFTRNERLGGGYGQDVLIVFKVCTSVCGFSGVRDTAWSDERPHGNGDLHHRAEDGAKLLTASVERTDYTLGKTIRVSSS